MKTPVTLRSRGTLAELFSALLGVGTVWAGEHAGAEDKTPSGLPSLITVSQVIATHFQTVAAANDYWRE